MALVDEAVVSRMLNFTGISNLISNRVYADNLPQNPVYPAIFYFQVDSVKSEHLDGSSGLAESRFQINVMAETKATAKTIAEQVRLCWEKFRGTVIGVEIQDVHFFGPLDQPPDPELGVKHVSADIIIVHSEAKP